MERSYIEIHPDAVGAEKERHEAAPAGKAHQALLENVMTKDEDMFEVFEDSSDIEEVFL